MNPDVFFENFELLADAPNGVQKLRELILQLAVMGKLVPQDPNDEPASVFDKETNKNNEHSAIEGKVRKSQRISKEEIPYELPSTWKWMRLSDISHDWGQKKPDVKFTYIDVTSINKELGLISEDLKILNPEDAPSRARKIVKNGTVIYSTVRPYLLNIAIVDKDFDPEPIVSTAFGILHPYSGTLNKYLYYYLRSKPFISYVESEMTGMAYPAINDTKLYKGLIPLPPLTEQKRIVSKVDELMALCDKLEARRQKKQEIQNKLNSAALDRMLSAEKQEEFEQHWQHICENFDLLYDNPENVEKLRQAILQLAVQGKLVPQDLNDEPASVLIEKIKAKKRQLIKAGKIKNSKVSAQIDSQEIPYELPDKWEWIRIEDITDIGTGSTPLKSKSEYYEDGSIPWITSSLTSLNYIDKAETYITETAVNECNLRIYPSGTLLVALYGQGKTRGQVSELRIEATINQACASIVFIENFENIKQYVKVLFEQKYEELRALAAGGAQPNLNVGKIKETLIPLPPLAEQKRIVEKVEQLTGLCDELESKLRKEQKDSEKLMEAVVKGLLEGEDTEKTELEKPIPLQVATIKLK
ncbi:Type I restriction-modification system, specificity subunit S [Methanosarcina barkeri str. Wiesmoor]|uniref:Type I restriction-modification system, specificity subunit S n=1 Tax=Methanosarcina barkeri str. Wiesmoor TaxID=1434109 RepID=A0A0E3LLL4_METBA|nr:restriction endonuclease subunit S [Methanosarcina barkeri]AKB51476.1 Type I restriction-modification system, specificity subunit S [Methanosarcina barkeri str. Wiesmoor]